MAIDTSEMQAIDTPEMQASAQRWSQKCSQDVHWSHLPADLLLELIDRFLDGSAPVAMVLTHVCRDWRETILGDRWILEKLKYRRLTFQGALADTNNANDANDTNDVLPAIFSKSLLHGNPYQVFDGFCSIEEEPPSRCKALASCVKEGSSARPLPRRPPKLRGI